MKTEIVKVNKVAIECPFENEKHYVAIRSICTALGIDPQKQFERIKSDEILSKAYTDTVYASDQKGAKRTMFCLELKYVFGWMFSIEYSKVNEKAKKAFIQFKEECYTALYDTFFLRTALYEKRDRIVAQLTNQLLQKQLQLKEGSEEIKTLKTKISKLQETPVHQLTIEFKEYE